MTTCRSSPATASASSAPPPWPGVLTPETAITLAGVRGREMAAACALEPTGMTAVLGGDPDEVLAAIEAHGLYPANRNGAGQIVAAGALDGAGEARRRAAREGPRHRAAGRRARSTPRTWRRPRRRSPRVAAGITPADPTQILLSNAGRCRPSTTAGEMLQRLVAPGHRAGALGPVHAHPRRPRRHRRHRAAAGRHPRRPGQARAQGRRRPEIVTLNTPDDLPAARDLIARHGMAPSHEPTMPVPWSPSPRSPAPSHPLPTSTRATQINAGQVHRAHRHPPGQRRGHRARLRRAHRVARPPRRPGRPRPTPRPHRRTPVSCDRSQTRSCRPASRSGMRAAARRLGHYQPSRVLTNDDLAQMVDTNDEWIRDRVGIADAAHRRRDETVADMATAAADKALAASGLTAADIDLVVVATCSSVDRCPNVATPGRRQARHRRAPARSTSTPPARASRTPWPPPTTRSAPAPPATPS